MKIKILLAPLLIVLMIVLAIWYIYPTYTDGLEGIKEKRVELKKEQDKLADLGRKIENSQKLSTQLARDEESRNVLFTYLPEKNKEEEIIDNLNFLISSDGGLLAREISVAQPEKKAAVASLSVEDESGAAGTGLPGSEKVQAKPEAEYFTVNLTVSGEYDRIKSFFEKIYRLKRFNQLVSLSVGKPEESSEEGAGSSSALEASAVLEFSVYKKDKLAVDADNKIFSGGVFTMNVIQKVKDRANMEILKLNVEQQGKSNPFLP
ncbi:MAG: hypothetical protein QG620_613 [Patescibacteria group bacterium]|nr:hypothetical protein [Patescibacteria group bacterium]